ncbi:hypothetical protein EDC01DRAFT_660754 [Geopyxis carbonaria]|nr:hypothetical protein EDC01DRAFT_660754 [Geopyxis carbonaria]
MSFSPLQAAQECTSLLHPSVPNLVFSFIIFLGILVSYLPQHYRIIQRGTSEGISPLFLLLGVTSGTCAFLNILILSWGVLGCCGKGIGGFNCFAASMGVAQVGLQWACFAVILTLFLIYFPRASPLDGPTAHAGPSAKTAVIVVVACILHFVVMASTSFYLSLLRSNADDPASHDSPPPPTHTLTVWANFLGVQSTVLASIQYIPQLWTTWRLKHVGSLSIPMMCIQTPGSFVWVVSLATREGTAWSTWVTYLITGILQGCLLIMCITWEMKERADRKKVAEVLDGSARATNGHTANGADERRPLLADS